MCPTPPEHPRGSGSSRRARSAMQRCATGSSGSAVSVSGCGRASSGWHRPRRRSRGTARVSSCSNRCVTNGRAARPASSSVARAYSDPSRQKDHPSLRDLEGVAGCRSSGPVPRFLYGSAGAAGNRAASSSPAPMSMIAHFLKRRPHARPTRSRSPPLARKGLPVRAFVLAVCRGLPSEPRAQCAAACFR